MGCMSHQKLDTEEEVQELKERYDCCSICMAEWEKDEVISRSHCDHYYHQSCIEAWVRIGGSTCPVCRRDLTTPDAGASSPQRELQGAENYRQLE